MSLILDALKKSEQQRQREKAPGLQSIHQPAAIATKNSMRSWWWLATIVVACNIAFFAYWFWRQQSTTTTPSPTVMASTATQSAESVDKSRQAQESQPRETKPEETNSQEAQAEFTRISPHTAATQTQVQSQTPDTAQRIEEISELSDSVRNNLPAMTFSFHVYSETPEQRTIIINDRRVREGDEISAGVKLQSITQDGVILLFEEHRIHISVLSGW